MNESPRGKLYSERVPAVYTAAVQYRLLSTSSIGVQSCCCLQEADYILRTQNMGSVVDNSPPDWRSQLEHLED